MKRFFSILMIFVLLFSLTPVLPVHVHAEALEDDISENETGAAAVFEERKEVVQYIRNMLMQRITDFTIKLPIDMYGSDSLESLYLSALEPAGDPKDGDSLLWNSVLLNCSVKVDAGYAYLYYSVAYLTTVQEENELDAEIDALLSELQCVREDDYGSVKKIYDWVCANVAYINDEGTSVYDFTAYGAMINRTATSQGFSLLIYQLLCKLGIQCRVVPGTFSGKAHLWNVVTLKGNSYNVDGALDAGKEEYAWFLKSDASFTDHVRNPECDDLHIDNADQNYEDFLNLCNQIGHDWSNGSCLESIICMRCGKISDQFGPHYFMFGGDICENALVCTSCGQLVLPQGHVYDSDDDYECNRCDHYRTVRCTGLPLKAIYTVLEGTEPPLFSEVPGMTVSPLENYENPAGGHVWSYELSFAEVGEYKLKVMLGRDQEPELLDLVILDHTYLPGTGRCKFCGKMQEGFCSHDWNFPTCMAPMTCAKCGLTEGEKSQHEFYTENCMTEPGVCTMCGLAQENPPGHDFFNGPASHCRRCGQVGRVGCTKAGAIHWMSSQFPDGFHLENTDPSISLFEKSHREEAGVYYWEYAIMAPAEGTYEVTFVDDANGDTFTVTAHIETHEYVNGRCWQCMEPDPSVHIHDYTLRTCTQPDICLLCGETSGDPLGHDFVAGPCTEPRACSRCDMVLEAPSHQYAPAPSNFCVFCGQPRYFVAACQGTATTVILSSSEGGDFYLMNPPSGFSLVFLEYFVAKGVYYWECALYTPGPGEYELDLGQKNSEQSIGLSVSVTDHVFLNGVCQLCGTLEEGGHTHTWKSATCQKSAVCSECGETEGTPLNHDYSGYACSEYARCARCGESRGKVSHTYDDKWDDHCNVCNQLRIVFCGDGGSRQIILYNRNTDGFYLKNAPSGVSMEKRHYPNVEVDGYYQHVYSLDAERPAPGTYEAVFADTGGKDSLPFTLQIYRHEYVDGDCVNCGKSDPDIHFHTWEYATCLKPKYCKTCGETEGEAKGHQWVEATCINKKYCSDCRITEGEIAPHDYVEWSCTKPGVCRYCNTLQDHPAGHTYDDDLDEFCNRCDQFRLIGCQDQILEIRFTSPLDTPYRLFNPEKGVSMILEGCTQEGDQYIHTYRVSAPGVGSYELTAVQEGNPEQENFTVQIFDHRYAEGFCGRCGVEMTGLPGDANGDGKVNYQDAMLVLRASIGLETLSEESKGLCDVDGKPGINYQDAMLILRASIGLEEL